MATSKRQTKAGESGHDRLIYSEFGGSNAQATERSLPDVPVAQQNLRIQVSRKGRGGKTVTVISGFQTKPEVLNALLKQLKNQCGTGGTMKEAELEIQGDHAQKLLQVLTQQGYKVKISGG